MLTEMPSSLLNKLVSAGFPTPPGGFVGCSDSEIADLERTFSVRLPEAYKDFLRVCGNDAGALLNFCMYQCSGLIKFIPPHLAELSPRFNLPAGNFVFVWDNDIILYFDTTQGNDPPVWRYDEVDNKSEQVFMSFSAWLSDHVTENISDLQSA